MMTAQTSGRMVSSGISDVAIVSVHMGWLSTSLKSTEKRSFQLPAIQKLCQVACKRLMLHSYTSLPQEQGAKTYAFNGKNRSM